MLRAATSLAVVLSLLALAAARPAAAEPQVTGARVVAPDRVTAGDRFHFVITFQAETGTRVALAPGALPLEYGLVSQPQVTTRSLGGGQSEITLDIEMAAFFAGPAYIPPLLVDYEEPGGRRGQVVTPSGSLVITSVLPADPAAIQVRDLKPQLEIGTPGSIGLFAGLLALAVVLLAVITVLIVRMMRPAPAPAPEALDTGELGPEDRARAILEAAGVAFGADRDFVAYYGAIAVTIRNYLTERYGFPAFALTTFELRNEMGRRGIDRWQARLVDGLLTQCDSAVYARYRPALERADLDLTTAFEIVEMSRPRPQPAEEPQEAPAR